jgi:hypothetical protein
MDMVPSPEGKFQEPPRSKVSVWKRLAASHDHATSEANAEEDKMSPRPMRKKRRSKHEKGTVAHDLGPTQACPPPSPHLDSFSSEVARPPSASSCVLDFSEVLAREEIALRRALFVSVAGTRPGVSGSDVLKEVRHCFGVKLEDMKIHQTYPEDFLLFLPDEDTTTKVLNEGRPLRGPRFSLMLKRWSRFAHASSSSMAELVDVKLIGIPQHAWCRSTVEHLLRDSCWVEALHSETMEMRDFSALVVKAWCFHPEKLVRKMDLHILEAGIDDQEKRFLTYKISIDILPPKTLQLSSATPPPPPPPPSGREPDDDDPDDQDPQQWRRPVPVDLRQPVQLRLGPRLPLGRAHAVNVPGGDPRVEETAPGVEETTGRYEDQLLLSTGAKEILSQPPVRAEVEEDLGESACVLTLSDVAGVKALGGITHAPDTQLGGTLGQATSSMHLGTFFSGLLENLCHDSPTRIHMMKL